MAIGAVGFRSAICIVLILKAALKAIGAISLCHECCNMRQYAFDQDYYHGLEIGQSFPLEYSQLMQSRGNVKNAHKTPLRGTYAPLRSQAAEILSWVRFLSVPKKVRRRQGYHLLQTNLVRTS